MCMPTAQCDLYHVYCHNYISRNVHYYYYLAGRWKGSKRALCIIIMLLCSIIDNIKNLLTFSLSWKGFTRVSSILTKKIPGISFDPLLVHLHVHHATCFLLNSSPGIFLYSGNQSVSLESSKLKRNRCFGEL